MPERKGMPFPLGVFDVKHLQFDKLPLQELQLTGAANLVDVNREFDLALMQLPFVSIPFEQSLLGAYCAETRSQIEPRFLVSPTTPFAVGFGHCFGMSFVQWDYRLVILDKGQREPLIDWLCTVALSDPRSRHLYRIRKQDGIISDVIEFSKRFQESQIPTIQIPLLVVESTTGSYYFVHKQKVGLTYPKLIRDGNHLADLDQFLARLREGERDLYGVKDDSVTSTPPHGADLLHRRDDDQAGGRYDRGD